MKTVKAIYAIRHKSSGEFVEANGKSCWKSQGAAKISFNSCWLRFSVGEFCKQDEYEVVDVLKMYNNLKNGGI